MIGFSSYNQEERRLGEELGSFKIGPLMEGSSIS